MIEVGDYVTYKNAKGHNPPRGRVVLLERVIDGERIWLVAWDSPEGEQRLKTPERSLHRL